MSRFVYAFAFLLLASTVSAAHVNGTLTIYPNVQDCSANATSVVLPNVTFGACNSYAVENTLFNFTAICSSRPGVLTIKFYSTSGCNDTAEITGATFVSEASGPKCNAVANNTLGNSNPASILVPSCTPPAATSAPTNATNPSDSPTATPTPTPTVPSNATQPPRNVAAQASVFVSLMAAAVAVIVMTLF